MKSFFILILNSFKTDGNHIQIILKIDLQI